MIRRSITLDSEVNNWIQKFRAKQLAETGKMEPYGNVVMELCRLGIMSKQQNSTGVK